MSGRTGPNCLRLLFLLLALASPGGAQQAAPEPVNADWTAQWIS